MLICIEGIDASGKATQAKRLSHWLGAKLLAFPDYESPTGKIIRGMLTGDIHLDVNDEVFGPMVASSHTSQYTARVLQSLMTVNRYEHIYELRNAKGSATEHLVLDRYWLSGLVYGLADGLEHDWLVHVNAALPVPDLTLYLDISVEESFKRRPKREDAYEANHERLEQARTNYFRCCESGYATVISGMGSPDSVAEAIEYQVIKLLERRA